MRAAPPTSPPYTGCSEPATPPSSSSASPPTAAAMLSLLSPMRPCLGFMIPFMAIMNMQAELALIQATLSTMQRPSPSSVTFPITLDQAHPNSCFDQISSSSTTTTTTAATTTTVTSMSLFDNGFHTQQTPSPGAELASFCNNLTDYNPDEHMINDIIQDAELQNFTSEFVSKYLPGTEFKSKSQ
ncbi:hypothetical protein Cgig2_033338 [Carnegiea gigantea]|uniref:Uncharacterized protein n=1 Tax=Carnegiea gigantea TaxID=171969 RepID=A0A9Q1KWF2_9CARY|nr:hypothetical protein Cgig2_033338 [Carnegiea gigantea]